MAWVHGIMLWVVCNSSSGYVLPFELCKAGKPVYEDESIRVLHLGSHNTMWELRKEP